MSFILFLDRFLFKIAYFVYQYKEYGEKSSQNIKVNLNWSLEDCLTKLVIMN